MSKAGDEIGANRSEESADQLGALGEWAQGDYCRRDFSGLVAFPTVEGEEPGARFSVDTPPSLGAILVSQTCDTIPRGTWDAEKDLEVVVAPLIRQDRGALIEVQRGTKPRFAIIPELSQEGVVADLGAPFTITKELLTALPRKRSADPGFPDRFARGVARFFSRFAFPDAVHDAMRKFRRTVLEKYKNRDSDIGKAFRSVRSIRIFGSPSWEAVDVQVQLLFILEDDVMRELSVEAIEAEIKKQIAKVQWPAGFSFAEQPWRIETIDGASARDIFESKSLDLNCISGSAPDEPDD